MSQESKRYAETYGGMLGAVTPLIVMIGSMLVRRQDTQFVQVIGNAL